MHELICEIGRRMYNKGFAAANDGNISVRLPDGTVLCTPSGVSKGFMTPDMLCRVENNSDPVSQNFKPSSEIQMHLRIYALRPDVQAVVHAHPPYATSFAVAGVPLDEPILPEAILMLGHVPIVPYGTPSTQEIPDALSPFLPHHDALLLANHGALTFGTDLLTAYHKMESLEFYAQVSYLTCGLGGAKHLTQEQITTLNEIRDKQWKK